MVKIDKTFSINDVIVDRNVEDKDFAIMEIWALGSGNNSHRNPISKEVLSAKENIDTFKGKFIIGKYDRFTNDVRSHEIQEDIYGYVSVLDEPKIKQKIIDGEEKDFVVVQSYISKIYAKEIIDMFKIDNKRSVSCEFSCALQYEEDSYGRPIIDGVAKDEDNPILAYSISGITLLSKKVNPSVKGADAVMKRFSEDSNKLETKSKGELMEEIKELSEQPKEEDIIMSEEQQKEDVVEEMAEKVEEMETVEETEEVKTTEEMSCGSEEEMSCKNFAVDLESIWCRIVKILENKYPDTEKDYVTSIYRIHGIYEEDGQKFVVVTPKENYEKLYKIKIEMKYSDFILSDEMQEVKYEQTFVPVEQAKEFADEEHKDFVEKLFSCEIQDMVKEIIEMKTFMEDRIKSDTEKRFSEIMVEPKLCLGEKAYNVLFEEGKNLCLEELDAFETKVKAFCDGIPKQNEQTDIMRFAQADVESNKVSELTADDVFQKYL